MDKKRLKRPMPTSEEPGEKAGVWEEKPGTGHAPCIQHHLSGEPPSKPSLQPNPWTWPTLTPYRAQARLPLGSEWAREPATCSHCLLPCCSGDPIKPCLNSFWALVGFHWLRKPRTRVSNTNSGWMISVYFCESQRYEEIWAKTWRHVRTMTAYLFSIMLERSASQGVGWGTPGDPETHTGCLWAQNYFCDDMKILFAFSTGLTFATGTKPTVGETACMLAQILAPVIAYFCHTLTVKIKNCFTDKSSGDINEFFVIA